MVYGHGFFGQVSTGGWYGTRRRDRHPDAKIGKQLSVRSLVLYLAVTSALLFCMKGDRHSGCDGVRWSRDALLQQDAVLCSSPLSTRSPLLASADRLYTMLYQGVYVCIRCISGGNWHIPIYFAVRSCTMYQSISSPDIHALTQHAQAGNAQAQYELGACYYYGRGVDRSDAQAVHWLTQAAEQGLAAAQNHLGACYLNGEGVPQSNEQAVRLMTLAAEQGLAKAQDNLAKLYQEGRAGLEQSDEQALKWVKLAVAQGYANSQCTLGLMYENGRSMPQSDEQAYHWYRLAAEQGYARGQALLAWLYWKGKGVEQCYTQARQWLERAAAQNYTPAMCMLGCMYQMGLGVPVSFVDAYSWFGQAAALGDPQAIAKMSAPLDFRAEWNDTSSA